MCHCSTSLHPPFISNSLGHPRQPTMQCPSQSPSLQVNSSFDVAMLQVVSYMSCHLSLILGEENTMCSTQFRNLSNITKQSELTVLNHANNRMYPSFWVWPVVTHNPAKCPRTKGVQLASKGPGPLSKSH